MYCIKSHIAYFCELLGILSDLVHDSLDYVNISSFFRNTVNRASIMSGDETKTCRLWSMATKTCLALTVKNNKVESVTCKESVRDDVAGESSRLQLFMLMNSFLSLVVWQPYFIIKFNIFDL